MDPFSALSIVGTTTGLVTLCFQLLNIGVAVERSRRELQRQLEEYDVLRLILTDSGRTILAHGQPPESAQAAMLTCAKRLREVDDSLGSLRRLDEKAKSGKPSRRALFMLLVKSSAESDLRQQAFTSFRDAVLLLRDMSSIQMVVMRPRREDVAGLQVDSLTSQLASRERDEWSPAAYREETGLDLEDLTRSKPKEDSPRPLLHTLVTSDYTLDATLVFQSLGGLTYVPVRGFVDTGSSAFIISSKVLERAGFSEEKWQRVDEETWLRGLEGVRYRPTHQVELTWYLDRRRYSRVDTFLVANDDRFDILLPKSLACPGGEVDTGLVLMLELRKKTDADHSGQRNVNKRKSATGRRTVKAKQPKRSGNGNGENKEKPNFLKPSA
ncbi:uncharacterized protein NECHADRAFT_85465 [Fusarium vanettenii 77-13-4]|uniref:Uncharacterized protein n=1 Tax=Fusarium vanettenii (strain ATCC MYA-4622 / CBS 123669 / FGSC 9596 / NRRL 45880 / 77-13-4) TaxID=660122 RepID=C7ZNP8_FUSV7|nr:uncharacterized protein NECHADRAFT_85465 [Fusarium vanettenii 77-13-4]EEU34214.1 predicted protein [Fusarium vanettenii 77-13-4]